MLSHAPAAGPVGPSRAVLTQVLPPSVLETVGLRMPTRSLKAALEGFWVQEAKAAQGARRMQLHLR